MYDQGFSRKLRAVAALNVDGLAVMSDGPGE